MPHSCRRRVWDLDYLLCLHVPTVLFLALPNVYRLCCCKTLPSVPLTLYSIEHTRREFYYHLKAAADTGKKPLAGLQHAVYGNGDETYFKTYMNVPRMIDQMLEKAGSRRFYARGEMGEVRYCTRFSCN